MDEAEWLESTDPYGMLEFLRGKASERKLRLFACACCRRNWGLITDERSRQAVETGEHYADDVATTEEREAALQAGDAAYWDAEDFGSGASWAYKAGISLSADKEELESELAAQATTEMNDPAELQTQSVVLRCIFGNPFRPLVLDSAWLTSTVRSLAQGIYDVRAFDRMPILADALEDAGCTDPQILEQCRGKGPHVRGCWCVDLILSKDR